MKVVSTKLHKLKKNLRNYLQKNAKLANNVFSAEELRKSFKNFFTKICSNFKESHFRSTYNFYFLPC